jgi:S-adenosylmethionine:tRNA ribosyltransferase-isomerase
MTLSDFDYFLPPELIAQHPLPERSASRLLWVGKHGLADHRFAELPSLLPRGALLIFNDTRVMRARLKGVKATGGQVEVLVERLLGEDQAVALIRASKPPRSGSRLILSGGAIEVTVEGRTGDLFTLRASTGPGLPERLAMHGTLPLPPYITHSPTRNDETRYQTIFAARDGAVAAPTAGLHFDQPLLATLHAQGIETARLTLHVGAGTFQPVRHEDLSQHRMHREWYEVPPATVEAIGKAQARGAPVVAVGTTSLRALESAARNGPLRAGSGETDLFITPGHRFRIVDRLISNFHLPKSTLLMLVSAFAGHGNIRRAYSHAIGERYRFFSYGDAMLLERAE